MSPWAAFLLFLVSAASANPAPMPEMRLQVIRLDCSTIRPDEIAPALKAAGRFFEKNCGVRLRLKGVRLLPSRPEWCELPTDPARRMALTDSMAAAARRRWPQDSRTLLLFLLPTGRDAMLSWAYVDRSKEGGCGAPRERRFLKRFGCLFVTDFGWRTAQALNENHPDRATPFEALLLAHEIVHALTHVPHPTRAARGHLMADSLTDMGEAFDEETCGCLKQSPYLAEAR